MNQNTEFTAEELAAIKERKNKMQRDWWAKMTPEERRRRRMQYALNAIRREEAAAQGQT